MSYDIFISFKNLDFNGNPTIDSEVASLLYQKLTAEGHSVFFSNSTIEAQGTSDYTKLIDAALDGAEILVVVASSQEYCESRWVRYEWDGFLADLKSGFKDTGEVYTLLCGGMPSKELPRGLRNRQFFEYDGSEESMTPLINFINSVMRSRRNQATTTAKKSTDNTVKTDADKPATIVDTSAQASNKRPPWIIPAVAVAAAAVLGVAGFTMLSHPKSESLDSGNAMKATTATALSTTDVTAAEEPQNTLADPSTHDEQLVGNWIWDDYSVTLDSNGSFYMTSEKYDFSGTWNTENQHIKLIPDAIAGIVQEDDIQDFEYSFISGGVITITAADGSTTTLAETDENAEELLTANKGAEIEPAAVLKGNWKKAGGDGNAYDAFKVEWTDPNETVLVTTSAGTKYVDTVTDTTLEFEENGNIDSFGYSLEQYVLSLDMNGAKAIYFPDRFDQQTGVDAMLVGDEDIAWNVYGSIPASISTEYANTLLFNADHTGSAYTMPAKKGDQFIEIDLNFGNTSSSTIKLPDVESSFTWVMDDNGLTLDFGSKKIQYTYTLSDSSFCLHTDQGMMLYKKSTRKE